MLEGMIANGLLGGMIDNMGIINRDDFIGYQEV